MEYDDMSEGELKECLRVHGAYQSSNSNSDCGSDGCDDFDQEYEAFKPPPLNIDPARDRITLITKSKGDTLKPVSLQSKTPVKKKSKTTLQNVEDKDLETRGRCLKSYISNKKKSKNQLMKQLRERQRNEKLCDKEAEHENQIQKNNDNGSKTENDKKKKNFKPEADNIYFSDARQRSWDDRPVGGSMLNNDIKIQDFTVNVENTIPTTSFQSVRTQDIFLKKIYKGTNNKAAKKIDALSQSQITDQGRNTLQEKDKNEIDSLPKTKYFEQKSHQTGIKKEEFFFEETSSKNKYKNIHETISNNREKNLEKLQLKTNGQQEKATGKKNKNQVLTLLKAHIDDKTSSSDTVNVKIENEEVTIHDENNHSTDTALEVPITAESSNSRKKIKFNLFTLEEHSPPIEQDNEKMSEFLPAAVHSRKSRRRKNKNKAKSSNETTNEVKSTKKENGFVVLLQGQSITHEIEADRQKCLLKESIMKELDTSTFDKTPKDKEKTRLQVSPQLETIGKQKIVAGEQENNKDRAILKPDKDETTLGLTDVWISENEEATIYDANSYEPDFVEASSVVRNSNKTRTEDISNQDSECDNKHNFNLKVSLPKSENIKKSKRRKNRRKEKLTSAREILNSVSNSEVITTDSALNQRISPPPTVLHECGLSKSQKRRLRRKACKNNNDEKIIKSQDLEGMTYREEREIKRALGVARIMEIGRRRPIVNLEDMFFAPQWFLDGVVTRRNEIIHNLREHGEDVELSMSHFREPNLSPLIEDSTVWQNCFNVCFPQARHVIYHDIMNAELLRDFSRYYPYGLKNNEVFRNSYFQYSQDPAMNLLCENTEDLARLQNSNVADGRILFAGYFCNNVTIFNVIVIYFLTKVIAMFVASLLPYCVDAVFLIGIVLYLFMFFIARL